MTDAPHSVRLPTRAVYAVFIANGVSMATWAARLPQVRDELGLTPQQLGILLLSASIGAISALTASGALVRRFGPAWIVARAGIALGSGLALAGVGPQLGIVWVAVGLFVMGFANGSWDVAMNVEAADVEHRSGVSLMSRFHAAWSVGTVSGALLGTAAVAADVPVAAHLCVVAGLVTTTALLGSRRFTDTAPEPESETSPRPDRVNPWREPRTLAIGALVLMFGFAQGTGNDWLAIAVIDGHGASAAVGTLTFAVFLTAQTLTRWFGTAALDRWGRVRTVRVVGLAGVVGAALFVLAPSVPLALLGAALWGLGVSLGFPVGMSAGADDPRHAAARVSTIATIGYLTSLAGPPLVGLLAGRMSVLSALAAVPIALALALLLTPALGRRSR